MAIVTLTVGTVNANGLEYYSNSAAWTAAEDTAGFKFLNDGKTLINIINADSGACTCTIDTPQPCNYGGTTVHDIDVSVTNGDDKLIGPFEKQRFNDADGFVTISITPSSDATAISARAVKSSYI
jgi:hypothetical protein